MAMKAIRVECPVTIYDMRYTLELAYFGTIVILFDTITILFNIIVHYFTLYDTPCVLYH
jgi:hypothetical protein